MKKVSVPEKGTALLGVRDENLKLIEKMMGVKIVSRGRELLLEGEAEAVEAVGRLFEQFAELIEGGVSVSGGDLKVALRLLGQDPNLSLKDFFLTAVIPTGKKSIVPRSLNQLRYLQAIQSNDIVLGIGPAGTGKTYLAVAQAVAAFNQKQVNRIILARPAVEAGEKLGFLPGDIQEKVNPYLRPLYDALYDMMDAERVVRLLERGSIEIAPIAFMRGRTLNDSFIILDEAQNTTSEQMKMFLTRLGFGSKAVVTGDITQIDLPPGRKSGLVESIDIVSGISGIASVYFDEKDVIRHRLVQEIVRAYERHTNGRQALPTAREAAGALVEARPAKPR
jgi:phosphate starvation-inducible PhoH-like protein